MKRLTYLVTVEVGEAVGPQGLPQVYAAGECARVMSEALAATQGVGQYAIQAVDGAVRMKERRGFVEEPLVALIEGAVGVVRDWEGHIAEHVRAMHEALQSLGYAQERFERRRGRAR